MRCYEKLEQERKDRDEDNNELIVYKSLHIIL